MFISHQHGILATRLELWHHYHHDAYVPLNAKKPRTIRFEALHSCKQDINVSRTEVHDVQL
ncbi:hypothetical protein SAMN06295960_4928 [Paenibacillus aquistagni]|uniref:Uncharacterized protein n=1 Tax=Paenibacillus aquistagni TaxID=1852522 RepID=A0A1X7M1H7_9BACL|nr:hypothetical protein SAMN06295960_4928 [Paenibacillus aquistagni]